MDDTAAARVTEVFERASATYDSVGVDFFGPIAAGLVDELAPRPGERALDVGCGPGAVLLDVASRVGPEGRVTGIDVAAGMVSRASADVAAAGLDGWVDVRIGDAMAPELPPASFDLVASSLVLFFLADPLVAVLAWHGLLVDGGRIGVSTFGPFNDEWREVEAVFRPYLPAEMRDARVNTGGPFASDAAMEELLTIAGFESVRTVTTTVPVRFEGPDDWYRWTMSHGQRQMWDAVPDDEVDAVRARAAEILLGSPRPDGRLGFEQGIRYTLGSKG
ncbi:MAG: methyltransferase domain-containing protein [Acidimicrobiales bacterium]|nr:methyltransferase domain-containing protein [Acidimicrobiales bacterium]